jgi:hypothetical protein
LARLINFLKKYPEAFELNDYEKVLAFLEKSDAKTERTCHIVRTLFKEAVLLADTGKHFKERKGIHPEIFTEFIKRNPVIRPIRETP